MMKWLHRARARLNDPDRTRATLAAMNVTPEELEWWRIERRRHRRIHVLRMGLPWMIAAAAGVLARHGIHGGKWIPGVIGAVFTGAFMALGTWSTTEKSIQLRELRGRRLRQALMEEDDAVPLRPGDPVRLLIARQPTALER